MTPIAPRHLSLEAIVRCIELYRHQVSSHSLLSFELFLMVAERNPAIATDLANNLKLARGVIAGALITIGEGGPGYRRTTDAAPGLISTITHPYDARSKLIALTPRGNQLAVEMRRAMGLIESVATSNSIGISGAFQCDG